MLMEHHSHPDDERKALCNRVRRVSGQLTAIETMIHEDRDCSEVLMQLVSARKALKSLSEKIIHSHLHHCIEAAQNPTEARKKLRELLAVLERYVE